MNTRYEYGAKRRADGSIWQHPLSFIKDSFRSINLTYVYGEIYRRPKGTNAPWELV